ncbi:MAG: TetR-like C-terminal domain-containing protein, partial [Myxococcota bacterium]
ELIAAAAAAGAELNRGVGTLTDEHARDDPEGAALAAWSLVHGFSLLWLNDAVDTAGDPVATVERLAGILFSS